MSNIPQGWQPGQYQPQPGDNRVPYGYQPQQPQQPQAGYQAPYQQPVQQQPIYQPPVYQQPAPQPIRQAAPRSRGGMVCPRCGSSNISIQIMQSAAKTHTRGTGFMQWFFRPLLIVCTAGLWLLIGKRKSTSKTKFKNEKLAICQNCGKSWKV